MKTEPLTRGLRAGAGLPDLHQVAHISDPWAALTTELKPTLTPEEARAEAYRCLLCGGPTSPAPCVQSCPSGIDIPNFVEAIARGDPAQAASTIMEANPLGGTCARVCPTEVLCEGSCVLIGEGQRALDIGRLQRFATDAVSDPAGIAIIAPMQQQNRNVAVIGAGPAGLACAAVLASLGYGVTVYDGHTEAGGLVRYAIAPYRQLIEPLPVEVERLRRMGIRFVMGTRIDTREAIQAVEASCDAIFLGVGMGKDSALGIEGSDLSGVWSSLPFIEAIKSRQLPEIGDTVAVIGAGNTAMDVARESVRLGAKHVVVIYRRSREQAPAFPSEIAEAIEEGVEFVWLTAPVRFLGGDRLRSIECQKMRLGEPDRSGRKRSEPIKGSEFELSVDTAILAIGQLPWSDLIPLIGVADANGYPILVDPDTGQTQKARYFTGGDVLNGGGSVVEAVRMGKIAADGIHRFLSTKE